MFSLSKLLIKSPKDLHNEWDKHSQGSLCSMHMQTPANAKSRLENKCQRLCHWKCPIQERYRIISLSVDIKYIMAPNLNNAKSSCSNRIWEISTRGRNCSYNCYTSSSVWASKALHFSCSFIERSQPSSKVGWVTTISRHLSLQHPREWCVRRTQCNFVLTILQNALKISPTLCDAV